MDETSGNCKTYAILNLFYASFKTTYTHNIKYSILHSTLTKEPLAGLFDPYASFVMLNIGRVFFNFFI